MPVQFSPHCVKHSHYDFCCYDDPWSLSFLRDQIHRSWDGRPAKIWWEGTTTKTKKNTRQILGMRAILTRRRGTQLFFVEMLTASAPFSRVGWWRVFLRFVWPFFSSFSGKNLSMVMSYLKENILYSKVAETKSVCHYYLNSRSCPYEKVQHFVVTCGVLGHSLTNFVEAKVKQGIIHYLFQIKNN